MTEKEIRTYIITTLGRLYENPIHRTQYKRFVFNPPDDKIARQILSQLTQNYILEQLEPGVVRLTDLGYQLIRSEISEPGAAGSKGQATDIRDPLPPAPDEIEKLSRQLEQPDYISASRFTGGQSEIYWATEGFKETTGYSIEELKKAGGSVALLRGTENQKKIEQIAQDLLNQGEVTGELEIITKSGHKQMIQFAAKAQYDSQGRVLGTLSAVKRLVPAR